jgi:hypothetical protein
MESALTDGFVISFGTSIAKEATILGLSIVLETRCDRIDDPKINKILQDLSTNSTCSYVIATYLATLAS